MTDQIQLCSYCQKPVDPDTLTEDYCAANLCNEGCGNAAKAPEGCTMNYCESCHEMIFPDSLDLCNYAAGSRL